MKKANLVGISEIKEMIIEFRGKRVILDSDLAMLYQVPTKRLIEQVKRNIDRFPSDFMFKLTREEWGFLRSQFATFGRKLYLKRYLPYVFTRNGANMVSAILKSSIAVQRSIQIIRAFTALEGVLGIAKGKLTESPDVLNKLSVHSRAIMQLFQKDKMKNKEIKKVRKVLNEMIDMLKKKVFEEL
ncbi:MAG: ORF6N domain-containing protein [Candidatus Margulisiibacteriota bacterium]|nr:ORF6N domain-containing protein [Candidatus Margulisiibacteriota bacterium]